MASQVEHVSGIDKQVSARFGQFGTRRCPLENVLAKPLFENLDVAAQCGLCDVKFLGCLAETASSVGAVAGLFLSVDICASVRAACPPNDASDVFIVRSPSISRDGTGNALFA